MTGIGYSILKVADEATGGQILALQGLSDGCATMPPGFEAVQTLFNWGKWVALGVCIACLIGFFVHLATERQNGGGSGSVGWLGKILIAIIGISGVFGLVAAVMTSGSGC